MIECINKTKYYVTVLSNLVRGLDKYSLKYSKNAILESTFKNEFYLIDSCELEIGIKKASKLLEKLSLSGNQLIVIETSVSENEIHENLRTGLGQYVKRNWVFVDNLYFLRSGKLEPISIEEAVAASFGCLLKGDIDYSLLTPRSVSVLPIARGCQAACPFCFSKASVSKEQKNGVYSLDRVKEVFTEAKKRGAERAVITGGGEPGVLDRKKLLELVAVSSGVYSKVVMITNGYHLGVLSEEVRLQELVQLRDAGLKVLSISRHHYNSEVNEKIMHLNTLSEKVAQTWSINRELLEGLTMRWVCVLQKEGIESKEDVLAYVNWSKGIGVEQICFKELYVSTSIESEYHTEGANEWSRIHQVPLNTVLEALEGWRIQARLPWEAPILKEPDSEMKVAAYTEPSLFWEVKNKICRSWNLMADGRCLASLEDKKSVIL